MNKENIEIKQNHERTESEMSVVKQARNVSALPKRKMVDIQVAVKNRSATVRKMEKRAKDLKNLIELDIVAYTLMDIAPMNEYELYIRSFGSSNSVQACTQWNEDRGERETQTDDWEIEDKWTQAPSEGMKDSDSAIPVLPWYDTTELLAKQENLDRRKHRIDTTNPNQADSLKLVKFLRKSSQVFDLLLEENTIDAGLKGNHVEQIDNVPFAVGKITLKSPSFLGTRQVTHICYSPHDPRIILTCLSAAKVSEKGAWSQKGIMILWRLIDPSTPYR